jgi:hypothetical protein
MTEVTVDARVRAELGRDGDYEVTVQRNLELPSVSSAARERPGVTEARTSRAKLTAKSAVIFRDRAPPGGRRSGQPRTYASATLSGGETEGSQTPRWRKPDSNLYGAFPVKSSFLVCWQFFVRSGKAVLRPVAYDQVRGARGRGQGTETVAKLGGLPLSVACVSQRLDA